MNKFLPLLLVMTSAPSVVWAQARAEAPSSPPKAAARPPAKAATAPAARRLAPAAQKAVEQATPIDDDPTVQLTPELLEVARTVYIGEMKCELGASVTVRAARRVGFFVITTRGARFLMYPVESRTGAIRLEDRRRGAMWLQLGNKSMLMSQKLGKRLADECQSPEQVTYAEYIKLNPIPSLLERPGPMHGQGHGPMHGQGQVPQDAAGSPAQAATPQPLEGAPQAEPALGLTSPADGTVVAPPTEAAVVVPPADATVVAPPAEAPPAIVQPPAPTPPVAAPPPPAPAPPVSPSPSPSGPVFGGGA